jgi:hypothetical protein
VEVVRAICIKARDKFNTIADRDRFVTVFKRNSQSVYGVLPLTDPICTDAGDLCHTR